MKNSELKNGIFVALGTFDGLHLGHKSVMTADKGEYSERIALMFCEHPQKVLTGVEPGELLTDTKRKELLNEWGITPKYIDFTEVCQKSAREFFETVLINELKASALSCGFNYRFGKNAEGDTAFLQSLCDEYGIKLTVCDSVNFDGASISSTRIRAAVKSGNIRKANAMLGRRFSYDFEVMHGDERGRTLGSPTINQFFGNGFTVPQFGVYASFTTVDGVKYPSVTNIGVRPTVGNSEKRSETHIIGFDGDLYGQNPEVELVEKLRNEKLFASFEELSEKIAEDRAAALTILEKEDN